MAWHFLVRESHPARPRKAVTIPGLAEVAHIMMCEGQVSPDPSTVPHHVAIDETIVGRGGRCRCSGAITGRLSRPLRGHSHPLAMPRLRRAFVATNDNLQQHYDACRLLAEKNRLEHSAPDLNLYGWVFSDLTHHRPEQPKQAPFRRFDSLYPQKPRGL